jgi:hypothetical protein
VNPAEIAAVRAVMTALQGAEPGTELALPDGSHARVQPGAPGVRAVQVDQADGNGWRLRVFEPLPERPDSYPPDVPFIAQCKTAITDGSDGHIMATWETAAVDQVADQIVAQSTATGWEPDQNDPGFAQLPLPMRMQQFKRGSHTRVVMRMSVAGANMVSLFDT